MTSQVRHHPPGPLHSRRERGEIPGKIKTCGFGSRASGKTGTKGKERKLGSRLRKTGLLVDETPSSHLCLPHNLRTSLTILLHPRNSSGGGFLSLFLYLSPPPPTIARKLNFNFEPRGCRSETNIIIRNNSDTREGRGERAGGEVLADQSLRPLSLVSFKMGVRRGRRRRRRWLRVV